MFGSDFPYVASSSSLHIHRYNLHKEHLVTWRKSCLQFLEDCDLLPSKVLSSSLFTSWEYVFNFFSSELRQQWKMNPRNIKEVAGTACLFLRIDTGPEKLITMPIFELPSFDWSRTARWTPATSAVSKQEPPRRFWSTKVNKSSRSKIYALIHKILRGILNRSWQNSWQGFWSMDR